MRRVVPEIANAEVVGTAVDRKELVHQSTRLSPDVVVAGTSWCSPTASLR
ncbi:response regulator transcription factor [Streptomyces californicus]